MATLEIPLVPIGLLGGSLKFGLNKTDIGRTPNLNGRTTFVCEGFLFADVVTLTFLNQQGGADAVYENVSPLTPTTVVFLTALLSGDDFNDGEGKLNYSYTLQGGAEAGQLVVVAFELPASVAVDVGVAPPFAAAASAIQRALGAVYTYTPLGGAPLQVRGVFEKFGVVIETLGDNAIETIRPTFTVTKANLPGSMASVGDTVLADSVTYTVIRVPRENLPDVRLILEA